MAYIELKDVRFAYPDGHLAVDGVTMSIEKGENVAIVGQNGAGKTTTVKLFNALHYPTGGDVIINGKSTKGQTTAQVSRTVGYVFQNPDDQIFHSTVLAEVEFGPRMMKLPEEKITELVNYALKITGMKKFREENPYNLPLSVRKFVTIAAIIAMDCDVMIFDEPTAGQDFDGNKRLSRILKELSEKGKTLITISHDMVFVADNFSRVIVMSNKKVRSRPRRKAVSGTAVCELSTPDSPCRSSRSSRAKSRRWASTSWTGWKPISPSPTRSSTSRSARRASRPTSFFASTRLTPFAAPGCNDEPSCPAHAGGESRHSSRPSPLPSHWPMSHSTAGTPMGSQ